MTKFVSYCSGESISSSMAPSCISPKIPLVFTLERTFFRSPTPDARFCISPSPLYTCSSCVFTSSKDFDILSSKVFCSFSSTTFLISSSFLLLSSCIPVSLVSTVFLMDSNLFSLSRDDVLSLSSIFVLIWVSCFVMAVCMLSICFTVFSPLAFMLLFCISE